MSNPLHLISTTLRSLYTETQWINVRIVHITWFVIEFLIDGTDVRRYNYFCVTHPWDVEQVLTCIFYCEHLVQYPLLLWRTQGKRKHLSCGEIQCCAEVERQLWHSFKFQNAPSSFTSQWMVDHGHWKEQREMNNQINWIGVISYPSVTSYSTQCFKLPQCYQLPQCYKLPQCFKLPQCYKMPQCFEIPQCYKLPQCFETSPVLQVIYIHTYVHMYTHT